jgi:hypothetical protein
MRIITHRMIAALTSQRIKIKSLSYLIDFRMPQGVTSHYRWY